MLLEPEHREEAGVIPIDGNYLPALSRRPLHMSISDWRGRRNSSMQPETLPLPKRDGAGDAAHLYDLMGDAQHVPPVFKNDKRFEQLARDPAHAGKMRPGGVREAISALYAENIGIVQWPVSRYPAAEYDFIDGAGTLIDVKTPVSPDDHEQWAFSRTEVYDSIRSELMIFHHQPEQKAIILLDVSYLDPHDYNDLHSVLDHNLDAADQSMIREITIPFEMVSPDILADYRARREADKIIHTPERPPARPRH